ncbi:molybdenum cofactor biosynthesis protein B [Pseudoalteromonas rubra]|uniref:Molybdenum cofactor biosynthesis protein B n=1 Tax=Pseudoalteromonas rubra TaxID=43658 RepID=A0A5S3WM49_9GAMM|nr:molybdenum cofactor biosynthesis protein B [Pseudoalteromonas rubra]TMP29074.1 molybdenum cofactor biosynthesis protein B [Pseudoalteromonas rubra]TMP33561.1 molybdenum cofactor biosynthesis protein B [Pseudoalteromonas rubra]
MGRVKSEHFIPLNIAILTVSNRRTLIDDTAGDLLQERIGSAGHSVADRLVVRANKYHIRAAISNWIVSADIQVIVVSGGTGLTDDDVTPEAIEVLFDKKVEGFGELFRQCSLRQIGYSTLQSRATAGLANKTLIVALPGSPRACELAWDEMLSSQLDARQGPCNFAPHLKATDADACTSRERN